MAQPMGHTHAKKGALATAGDAAAGGHKINYLEWARAFGALGIVLLHTCIAITRGVSDIGTGRLIAYREVGMLLSRWCVPVFLMVSGTLLLDPARDVGLSKLRRYVGRMLFVICTIGLVFALVKEWVQEGAEGWSLVLGALRDVLCAQSWSHLWYLYAMVGLYALTPVLRAFTARATREEYQWVLGFLVAFSLGVYTANALLGWELTQFYLAIPNSFVYYLLGYYAHAYLRFDWRWGVVGAASALAMAFFIPWGTQTPGIDTGAIYAPESPLICVYAASVFLGLRRFLDGVDIGWHRIPSAIARYSFGIYVIHPLFGHLAVRFTDPLAYPAGLYELVVFAVSVAGSMAITWLLKRLPGFRHVL